MVYKQKLSKIGNSVGLSLPKALRDGLGLKQGDAIYIKDDDVNDRIIVSKKQLQENDEYSDKEFYEIVKRTGEKYSEALGNLAKK